MVESDQSKKDVQISELSNKELATRFKAIASQLGTIQKTVQRLKVAKEEAKNDSSTSEAVAKKAEENWQDAKNRLDRYQTIESDLEDEIEKRGINTWDYY